MKSYLLYDKRYLYDPDKAVCFESCDNLKEAKHNSKDYDCVIVEYDVIKKDGENYLENPKIIQS